LLSVPRVRTTFASCGFSVAAPVVWNSLPFGIHDFSSTHTFLKLTAFSRPSAPPSGSPKCFRFGHWLTLCTPDIHLLTYLLTYTHTHNHFTALWTLSGTTRVSRYQKVHFAIFWMFWSKMKITQADAPTIWMDCHPIQTNRCLQLCHPHHFYAGCPSLHNPTNLSWLGSGTKYAGLHTHYPVAWFRRHYRTKQITQKVSFITITRYSAYPDGISP